MFETRDRALSEDETKKKFECPSDCEGYPCIEIGDLSCIQGMQTKIAQLTLSLDVLRREKFEEEKKAFLWESAAASVARVCGFDLEGVLPGHLVDFVDDALGAARTGKHLCPCGGLLEEVGPFGESVEFKCSKCGSVLIVPSGCL